MAAFLRAHRRRAGLTLDALAEATGLTKSYLSKIERGMSTPSIAVALKVADVLDTDVEQLFSSAGDASALVIDRDGERAGAEGSPGAAVYEPIATGMVRKSMQPFLVRPTTQAGQPYMDHPGEEFIFVQQGTVEVEIPTQVITLAEGDSLYFDSSTPHRVRSVSAERAVVMVVVYDRVDDVDAKTLRRRCGPTA